MLFSAKYPHYTQVSHLTVESYLLVGVRGVLGTSNSVWWLFLSTTGSSTTFMLLFCIISCNMLNSSSARAHLKAKIPINTHTKKKKRKSKPSNSEKCLAIYVTFKN